MNNFPVYYTLDYVLHNLPANCRRILEVGCGEGELARNLLDVGFEVVAVDDDLDAVTAARQLGVTVHHGVWPELDVSGFDAVLFTRSLHHVRSLRRAVEQAQVVLNPAGRVIVEDFRYTDLDKGTIMWFAGMVRLLMATGVIDCRDDWLTPFSEAKDPVSLWRTNHGHDLHSADAIHGVLREVFGKVERIGAAYFFRYVSSVISERNRRERIGKVFSDIEEFLVDSNQIEPLGQRFVAQVGV